MRDENQCLHGRDAHAPLAFASHPLSSHFRISETGLLISRALPIGTKGADRSTQAVPPARRDALLKIQKQAAFGIDRVLATESSLLTDLINQTGAAFRSSPYIPLPQARQHLSGDLSTLRLFPLPGLSFLS